PGGARIRPLPRRPRAHRRRPRRLLRLPLPGHLRGGPRRAPQEPPSPQSPGRAGEGGPRVARKPREETMSAPHPLGPTRRMFAVVIDTADPERLVAFWSDLLTLAVVHREEGWIDLEPLG